MNNAPDLAFDIILEKHPRVAVVGGPNVGKTTLCIQVKDRPVFHTDDWRGREWSDIPDHVMRAIGDATSFVVEGTQVARVLRKGLDVDAIVIVNRPPFEAPTEGQTRMAKAIETVMAQVLAKHPAAHVYRLSDHITAARDEFSMRAG